LPPRRFSSTIAAVGADNDKDSSHEKGEAMTGSRGWRKSALAVALGLSVLSGCQTWVPEAGLTLPNPSYLKHQPQYIPPSPPFPLSKELTSLQEASAQQPAAAPQPLGP
jgi:hypothetical protein